MNRKKIFFYIIITALFLPIKTQAVPPPEIINNFGVLLLQIFTIVSAGLSTLFYFLKRLLKPLLGLKGLLLILTALIIAITGITYQYQKHKILTAQQGLYQAVPPVAATSSTQALTPAELKKLLDENANIALFDARLPEEYESGHLRGAQHLSFEAGTDTIREIAGQIDPQTLAVVYCIEGIRSSQIADRLAPYHPHTAYLNGWAVTLEDHWQGDMVQWSISRLISREKSENLHENGVLAFDPRQSTTATSRPYAGTLNIPISEQSRQQTFDMLSPIDWSKGYYIVCSDKASCFEAYMLNYRIQTYLLRTYMNKKDIDHQQVFYGLYNLKNDK